MILPVSSAIAETLKHGNPDIEVASACISRSENGALQKISSSEEVYFVDIKLQATKKFASFVNGTISFKDRQKLVDYPTINKEKNSPEILENNAQWQFLKVGKEKNQLKSFLITGFSRLPEEITFKLQLDCTNPNDKKSYSESIEVKALFFSTTLDIISVSNPPDSYKGDSIPMSITVKNTGRYTAYNIVFSMKIRSVTAGSTTYGMEIYGYRNVDGNIILEDTFYFIAYIIKRGQERTFDVTFHYAHSNGAMNVGKWEVIEISAEASNSNTDVVQKGDTGFYSVINSPSYYVTPRAFSDGPHSVFIYYLYAGDGGAYDWPEDPFQYFYHTNYGDIHAGLHMFKHQYNNRDVANPNDPIDFDMDVLVIDKHLTLTTSDNTIDEIYTKAKNYMGTRLKTRTGIWRSTYKLEIDNCGFDILLVLAYLNADHAGKVVGSNSVVVCAGNGASALKSNWKYNVDGLVQHEISHLFGCHDRYSQATATFTHPDADCIMFYYYYWDANNELHWGNCLFEKITVSGPTHNPTNQWCTGVSSQYHCTNEFEDNWNQFYKTGKQEY